MAMDEKVVNAAAKKIFMLNREYRGLGDYIKWDDIGAEERKHWRGLVKITIRSVDEAKAKAKSAKPPAPKK